MDFFKILLFASLVSAIIAYTLYIRLIAKNQIKPHGVTYLVWSIILGLNFVIQLKSGVGISAFFLGVNFLGCGLVFLFCLIKGHVRYDKLDWFCFALAIIAILLWLFATTPLYSVILSCVIDFFAIFPSFRKSFKDPWEDSPIAYWIAALEYLFSIPSYQVFSIITLSGFLLRLLYTLLFYLA
jgi:hypothetical protein